MKRYRLLRALTASVFVGLCAAVASPPDALAQTPAAAAAPSPTDVAAKVQGFYNQTTTFQATFEQTYKVKAYNTIKRSTGRVVFSKPGKMNWTYDAPNGNRVVSDGRTLRVYEKENNQMFEQGVDKSQYPAALSFLMGQGNLTQSFTLKFASAPRFEGGYVLDGTPIQATPAYQKVLFFVDGATSQVRQVIIYDAQGNRNQFTFTAPAVNEAVDETQFSFTPPPGTQILHP